MNYCICGILKFQRIVFLQAVESHPDHANRLPDPGASIDVLRGFPFGRSRKGILIRHEAIHATEPRIHSALRRQTPKASAKHFNPKLRAASTPSSALRAAQIRHDPDQESPFEAPYLQRAF